MNFASGGGATGAPPPGTAATTPSLIGKVVSALTRTVPPTTLEMIGVTIENSQSIPTETCEPSAVPDRDDRIREWVRQGAVDLLRVPLDPRLVSGSLRLLVRVVRELPGGRMIRRIVCGDPDHLLHVDPAKVDPPEVDRDQQQEEKDRKDDRELHHALATGARATVRSSTGSDGTRGTPERRSTEVPRCCQSDLSVHIASGACVQRCDFRLRREYLRVVHA